MKSLFTFYLPTSVLYRDYHQFDICVKRAFCTVKIEKHGVSPA